MSEEIHRALGRIEGALEAIHEDVHEAVKRLESHITRDDERFDKHASRLGTLENWRWFDRGITAGIAALMGALGGHFPKL